jgi:hypothetical protein
MSSVVMSRATVSVARSVDPVGPDVPERPQLAALGRVEAPVPVGVQEQPVLEIPAGDQADATQSASPDRAVQVLVEGIEADVVVDRADAVAGRREGHQLRGLLRSDRERFLADHMPPGREDRLDLRVMQVVGRRDVHHLDRGVGEQVVQAAIRHGHPQASSTRGRALARRAEDAVDRDPEAPKRLDMDRADEPGADHGRSRPTRGDHTPERPPLGYGMVPVRLQNGKSHTLHRPKSPTSGPRPLANRVDHRIMSS